MSRRSRAPLSIEAADQVAEIKELLDDFVGKIADADLREQVRSLIPAFHKLRDLGAGLIPRETATSARDRIIAYLCRYPMSVIDGDELMVVSGISEWPRRVRELRVQFGWSVYSGVTIGEMAEESPEEIEALCAEIGADLTKMRPDQYFLASTMQDRDAAHRWHTSNAIRKKKISVKAKILEFLQANVGIPVTIEELRYLAGDASEWARRVRELRTEEGWPIFSKMQGRSDLPVGSYVLEENKQAQPHDRRIPDDVRVEVLKRDGYACVHCGWRRDDAQKGDPRHLLELHHMLEHAAGGENTVENLMTLCNVDHDAVHAGRLKWNGTKWVKSLR